LYINLELQNTDSIKIKCIKEATENIHLNIKQMLFE
jgi:hypothetical protein